MKKIFVLILATGVVFLASCRKPDPGVLWTEKTKSAAFDGREIIGNPLVYNDRMWLIAGTNSSVIFSDVWSSKDGKTWDPATRSAGFTKRSGSGTVVHKGGMWVIGGWNGTQDMNDVWNSSDGAVWSQVTKTAGFSPRDGFGCLDYKDKIWVIAGYNKGFCKNDVWNSDDGITWKEVTPAAAFAQNGRREPCI